MAELGKVPREARELKHSGPTHWKEGSCSGLCTVRKRSSVDSALKKTVLEKVQICLLHSTIYSGKEGP